ncbi:lysosomal pro-x carboxypeptidase-like [Plakobranchus ocellatus]|uniref:Lysosomal pro-x carboxypeptidase-like n=1 Tax=Plakobranchus ocellatus TaxID=259542 RepID=A0AAV3YGI2_9GAST|nr:lysosomal pro-x carboxypeptidase-like [Plakobranchus ocellatus]
MDWNFQAISDACMKEFGVRPRRDWVKLQYWGTDLSTASNIIFSNGDLDPWSSGGVTKYISESIWTIKIPEGAHHLDLRASNKDDTEYVKDARTREINIIKQWLNLTP